jgi:FKBP-type peptidyl-prolyl cis-trans isomerase FkpA
MSPMRTVLSYFVSRPLLQVLVVLPLAALLASCGSSNQQVPTAPTPPTGPATMQVTDLVVGDGDTLNTGLQGTFVLSYWVYDPAGTDSKGALVTTTLYPFRPGVTNTLTGLAQGVLGMQVHGKRRLIIPPSLAWGATGDGTGVIAPNAWVVFELELVEVRDCTVSTCTS